MNESRLSFATAGRCPARPRRPGLRRRCRLPVRPAHRVRRRARRDLRVQPAGGRERVARHLPGRQRGPVRPVHRRERRRPASTRTRRCSRPTAATPCSPSPTSPARTPVPGCPRPGLGHLPDRARGRPGPHRRPPRHPVAGHGHRRPRHRHPVHLHRRPRPRLQGRRPLLDPARHRPVDLARRRPARPVRASAAQKAYVDYAAERGWPYEVVDAGWYFGPTPGTPPTRTGRPTAGCPSSSSTRAPRASASSSGSTSATSTRPRSAPSGCPPWSAGASRASRSTSWTRRRRPRCSGTTRSSRRPPPTTSWSTSTARRSPRASSAPGRT